MEEAVNKIIIGITIIMMVILSGCTTGQVSATTAPPPCNLSTLKIKSVKIEGDHEDFVSRAIKSELYKRGAMIDQGGVEVVGVVRWGTLAPLEVSVEVATMAFASTAINGVPLGSTTVTGAESLAKQVADDFCQCLAATAPAPDRTKK